MRTSANANNEPTLPSAPSDWHASSVAQDSYVDEADIEVLHYGATLNDDRTLVGLGPADGAPDSEQTGSARGVPRSEPPGPWGSDEDEIPASLRPRKMGLWRVALPLLGLVAGSALVAVRLLGPGTSPRPSHASRPALPASNANTGIFVRVASPDARVFVDGQDRGPPPVLVVGLTPGSHVVSITEPSSEPFEQPVTITADQVSSIEPVLTPKAPDAPEASEAELAAPAATPELTSASVTSKSVASGRVGSASAVQPIPVTLDESEPGSELSTSPYTGSLRITSNPPASVVVDGRPLGKAPRAIELPPGPHVVVFVHPELGRKSVTVNVTRGQMTRAAVDF